MFYSYPTTIASSRTCKQMLREKKKKNRSRESEPRAEHHFRGDKHVLVYLSDRAKQDLKMWMNK